MKVRHPCLVMSSFRRNQFVRQYEKVNQNSKRNFIVEELCPDNFLIFKLLDVDVCQLWKRRHYGQ